MKEDTLKIGTWPTPEKPFSIEIPKRFLSEFASEIRIIEGSHTGGIPASISIVEKLQDPEIYQDIANHFDVMLIPK